MNEEISSNKDNAETTKRKHCQFFVPRKKRYCRMTPKDNDEFCGEHQKTTTNVDAQTACADDQNNKIRIICPLDNKHTCYAHNLKKHLKICNARKGDAVPHIIEGINSGKDDDIEDDNYQDVYKLLSTFPVADIKRVIMKIDQIYNEHIIGKISDKILQHKIVEEEMQKPEYGDRTKKHLKQASSILGLLEEYNLLQQDTCFIEFGAGRGQLSYWIANATENLENISVLLVERASPKHKRDNKLNNDQIKRIRADIADLVLDEVEIISKTGNIVGVTKHLCGGATDLALRCLANVAKNREKLRGAIMTFCCHHRCRWAPYVGKDFFKEMGITKYDFDMMCGIVSWATCGSGYSRERKTETSEEEKNSLNKRESDLSLTREEKEVIGRKCKNVFNWGRLKYLEKLDFNCKLHHYVNADVSLENVCIVACK